MTERHRLAGDAAGRHLLQPVPSGVHFRPVGFGKDIYGIWTYEVCACACVMVKLSTSPQIVFPLKSLLMVGVLMCVYLVVRFIGSA